MQSWFIWNGKDCRGMGIVMRGPAAIVRPEERVNHVTIPGMSGDLTETEGEDVYNSYIQTATIAVHGWSRVREVFSWLRGSGFVTFSGEPDRKQPARIIGAVTLDRHSRNLDWWEGEVQFYCQPLKELLRDAPVTAGAINAQVRNIGDVAARPLWYVHGGAGDGTMTLSAGGNTLSMSGLSSSGFLIWVDSRTMEVWNNDRSQLLTKLSSGEFPVLRPGANVIGGSGWTSVDITKRERFL